MPEAEERSVGGGRICGHRFWIAVAYFLFAAAPGCWLPTISRTLIEMGWGDMVRPVFLVMPLSGLLSPLLFAALADQRVSAERILVWTVGGGCLFLWLAFETLEVGKSRSLFIFWMIANALVVAPAWPLLNVIALTHLPASKFGLYRGSATAGWALAGVLVSFLAADASALSGKVAVAVRLLACLACVFLPATLPRGEKAKSWREAMGLGALGILRNREIAVYFLAAFLLAIPMAAHYMHTPLHLGGEFGVKRTAAWMTLCQATEVVALVAMGYLIVRWPLRKLFIGAMIFALGRFAFNAIGAHTETILPLFVGLGFAGVAWAIFFEGGRIFVDRRVEVGLRAQAQALLSLATMTLGTIVGTILVEILWVRLVGEKGAGGREDWALYWWVLTGVSALALAVYVIGGKSSRSAGSRI